MTPQPRHIEAATEMVDSWYEAIDQYDNMVNELARALAEAENRAAWRGYELGTDWADEYMKCKYDEAMAARDKMSIEYGPRPTKENRA